MAKALIGYLNSDLRTPAHISAENHRLRMRVGELESLVLRLQAENDRLTAAEAASLLDLDRDARDAGRVEEMLPA